MTEHELSIVADGAREICESRALDAALDKMEELHLTVGITLTGGYLATVTIRVVGGTTVHVLQYGDETIGDTILRATRLSRMSVDVWHSHVGHA